jgi:hypothetical protein
MQMLTDMLLEALLPSLRNEIFDQLKGPASIKIAGWYKVR